MVPKTIAGDGRYEAAMSAQSFTLSDESGQVIVLSRAELREVILGAERYEKMEEEEETP